MVKPPKSHRPSACGLLSPWPLCGNRSWVERRCYTHALRSRAGTAPGGSPLALRLSLGRGVRGCEGLEQLRTSLCFAGRKRATLEARGMRPETTCSSRTRPILTITSRPCRASKLCSALFQYPPKVASKWRDVVLYAKMRIQPRHQLPWVCFLNIPDWTSPGVGHEARSPSMASLKSHLTSAHWIKWTYRCTHTQGLMESGQPQVLSCTAGVTLSATCSCE